MGFKDFTDTVSDDFAAFSTLSGSVVSSIKDRYESEPGIDDGTYTHTGMGASNYIGNNKFPNPLAGMDPFVKGAQTAWDIGVQDRLDVVKDQWSHADTAEDKLDLGIRWMTDAAMNVATFGLTMVPGLGLNVVKMGVDAGFNSAYTNHQRLQYFDSQLRNRPQGRKHIVQNL